MQAHLRSLSLSPHTHTHTHTLHLRSAQVTWKQHEARIRGEQPAARQAGDQPSPLAGVLGTGARGTPAGGLRWSPAPLRKRTEAALGAQREAQEPALAQNNTNTAAARSSGQASRARPHNAAHAANRGEDSFVVHSHEVSFEELRRRVEKYGGYEHVSATQAWNRVVLIHPKPYTPHPAPYTRHTPHPTPCTLHPAPCTLHLTLYALHPKRRAALECSGAHACEKETGIL